MFEFVNRVSHIARKPHKCELCGGDIRKGEKYISIAERWDGQFLAFAMHEKCDDITLQYLSECSEEEYCYSDVADWWLETRCSTCGHFTENSGECDSDCNRGCWCTKYKSRE